MKQHLKSPWSYEAKILNAKQSAHTWEARPPICNTQNSKLKKERGIKQSQIENLVGKTPQWFCRISSQVTCAPAKW